jgi:hypothetical protein
MNEMDVYAWKWGWSLEVYWERYCEVDRYIGHLRYTATGIQTRRYYLDP